MQTNSFLPGRVQVQKVQAVSDAELISSLCKQVVVGQLRCSATAPLATDKVFNTIMQSLLRSVLRTTRAVEEHKPFSARTGSGENEAECLEIGVVEHLKVVWFVLAVWECQGRKEVA